MPKTQNGGWSVAASPSQAGDSELVYLLVSHPCRPETQIIVSVTVPSFAGLRLRMEVVLLVSLWTCRRLRTAVILLVSLPFGTQTQNGECLLGRYLYLFPMRRRLQSGASPFPGCDWLFPSEWGTQCGPPLFPPVELICIVQTHI